MRRIVPSLSVLGVLACSPPPAETVATSPSPPRARQLDAEQAEVPSASIAAADGELARALASSGPERLRAFSRARLVLERVTKAQAEPVVWRAPFLLPDLAPVELAELAGTTLAVAGIAAAATPGGALVIEADRLLRYRPEPTVLIGSRAEWPLVVSAHYARTGFGSNVHFADLDSASPREATADDRTFFLADGSRRVVEESDKGIRLGLPSGRMVALDPHANPVVVDDVAGRVVTYWPLGPLSPEDTHVLELSVFDARDGHRIARSVEPPTDVLAVPAVSMSADGSKLVASSSHVTNQLSFATNKWKSVGSYQLELLGGGALEAAFTSDGSHLCATWADTWHVVPNDLPKGTDAVCVFEMRTPFHKDARIGCVEREPGWVTTRSSARPVSVVGATIATGVRKVAALQNVVGVDPLPGGLAQSPEVAVRLVIADADTCKIERRIDLGKRRLDNQAAVRLSADASIVELSGEAFDVRSGKPTAWSSKGRSVREDEIRPMRWVDAARQPVATVVGADPKNRATFFVDRAYRFEGDYQRDARCRFGTVLAPIELCPPPLDAAAVAARLRGASPEQ